MSNKCKKISETVCSIGDQVLKSWKDNDNPNFKAWLKDAVLSSGVTNIYLQDVDSEIGVERVYLSFGLHDGPKTIKIDSSWSFCHVTDSVEVETKDFEGVIPFKKTAPDADTWDRARIQGKASKGHLKPKLIVSVSITCEEVKSPSYSLDLAINAVSDAFFDCAEASRGAREIREKILSHLKCINDRFVDVDVKIKSLNKGRGKCESVFTFSFAGGVFKLVGLKVEYDEELPRFYQENLN